MAEPDPLLVIDGVARRPAEIMIIAFPLHRLEPRPGERYQALECRGCGIMVMGDDGTAARAALGCPVYCPECGLLNHPDVHAGYDPDDGRPLTIADFANRPNLIGAFRDRRGRPRPRSRC